MVLIEYLEIALKILAAFYFLFILFLFRGITKIKSHSNRNNLKASIIIPFRNEEKFLRRCIESILDQDFERSRFEIIIIDDHSSDNSIQSINDLIEREKIKLIKLQEAFGKKKAIQTGIELAQNEIIVTTDADCFHNKKWLRSLIETFDNKTGFVAGKIVYSKARNLFEEFQKIEFASLVSIGSAFIGNQIPLLANGASCAYRKDLFYKVGGFKDNLSLASGDEEFLMQKIHFDTDYKVKFCAARHSTTFTEPIHSIKKFLNQRKRWVSKVPFYRNKILIPVLSFLYLFYIFFLLSVFVSFSYMQLIQILITIFVFKVVIDSIFLIKGYLILELGDNVFEIIKLILLIPFAEIFHFLYISIVPILSFITGFKWKEREFKR